jgi:hypothetical protein
MSLKRSWMPLTTAMITGLALGWCLNTREPVFASGNTDRHEDFVIATGPINQGLSNNAQFLQAELDGVWVLDYKSGKLLATTMNRQTGKTISFGEVDLVKEFDIAPRANVHFVMSTGMVVKGQSVLYLVETTTGKMGVYSMVQSEAVGVHSERIIIRRHDMLSVRTNTSPPAVNVQNLDQSRNHVVPNALQGQPLQPNLPVNPAMQNPILPPSNFPQPGGLQQTGGFGPGGK